jgi:GxxExxY protein
VKEVDIPYGIIINASIEVHRQIGPGLLESVYDECLCTGFRESGAGFERQVLLPVSYKGRKPDCGYRLDRVIDKLVVLALKAVKRLEPIHHAQLLTYLRLAGLKLGILLNFNELLLKEGIKRVVNNLQAFAIFAPLR